MITNREISTIIWLTVILVFALTKQDVRRSVRAVISATWNKHIIIGFSLYFSYIALGVYIARRLGFWNADLLKDTLLWIPLIGLPLLMRFGQASENPRFFRNEAIRVFEVSVFIEFFLGLQTFSLPVELILVPVAFFLTLSAVFSENDPRFAQSKTLLNTLLAILGILVVVASIWKFIGSIEEQDFTAMGRSLLLVVWLPLFALPFVYVFSLYAFYELAFIRLGRRSNSSTRKWKNKLGLIISLHVNVSDVSKFGGPWPTRVADAKTFSEAKAVADRYKVVRRTNGGNLWTD